MTTTRRMVGPPPDLTWLTKADMMTIWIPSIDRFRCGGNTSSPYGRLSTSVMYTPISTAISWVKKALHSPPTPPLAAEEVGDSTWRVLLQIAPPHHDGRRLTTSATWCRATYPPQACVSRKCFGKSSSLLARTCRR